MKVELLKYTEGGLDLVAHSARVSGVPEGLSSEEIIRMIVDNDYSSALEHIVFTFDLRDISVALSRELLEHRIASHTARSTRYVEEADFGYFIPKEFEKNEEAKEEFIQLMEEIARVYRRLREMGITRESTRYVLPLATHTNYIWTINVRSLINFLGLRLCVRASPELRELARMIHREVIKVYPEIFRDLGCRGKNWSVCPENAVRDSPQGKGCPYKVRESKTFIPTKDDIRSGRGSLF
jgi:thymidylate synthase (FAD)